MNKSSFIFAALKPRDDNKVQQIFSATLELVVQSGVAGVTMRQIARAAGMATGTLYIYFRDKEELLNQLYMSCRVDSVNAYFQGYDAASSFKKGFKVVWHNILQHRLNHFAVSVFMEQCYHSPFIYESTREMNERLFQPLFKFIERGKKEKILKDLDNLMLLALMMGTITGAIKFIKYHKKKTTEDRINDAFMICWDGLTR